MLLYGRLTYSSAVLFEVTLIIKLLKKLFRYKLPPKRQPVIVARAGHGISRKNISSNALKVLHRLHEAGFNAYLVGGGVRDLLLDRHPKDFDVATNARPEEIKKLFRNCLLIGRRFRLAHIRFGHDIIEVATLRAGGTKTSKQLQTAAHGMLLRDNVFGTLTEDAERRDFTINALYYNIADFSIIDYWGGLSDLQNKTLRIIGDPRQRYQEDPVRLLRAIRFAGKLDFQIAPETRAPIAELAPLLQHVPAARLFDEVLKLFHSGQASRILPLLREYNLFEQLFRPLALCLHATDANVTETFLTLICATTDARVAEAKTVSPSFLFACFLWQPLHLATAKRLQLGELPLSAHHAACHEVIQQQAEQIAIPKRFSLTMKEIWDLQYRLQKLNPKSVQRLLEHPRFRAAYDFLLLRAQAGEAIQPLAHWWQHFHDADTIERQRLLDALPKLKNRRRKTRKTT